MEKTVKLDCGATLRMWAPNYGCLVYADLFDLATGSISVPGANNVKEATLRISVMNLPGIKKLIDGLLKDPEVKARIKFYKEAGAH